MSCVYEVIVVGGGHAGCEAALAAARMGAKTALVSFDRDVFARLSCNPSIGGMAKSHIVFEVDALGGEMGRNADYTGIQFRTLNTRKGPAVQALRAQCDKEAYPLRMLKVLRETPNLELIYAQATGLSFKGDHVCGVFIEKDTLLRSKTVVLANGTFLNGRIYIGKWSQASGRIGDQASVSLAKHLAELGIPLRRLKTGTPPRLHKDSLNYSAMEVQPGLEPPPLFSAEARKIQRMFHVEQPPPSSAMFHVEQSPWHAPWVPGRDQIPCYLTHTTEKTHEIIRTHLTESSLYGGMIDGTGVRYCPSIEDKIVKFHQKSSHHVFIEPEGRLTPRIYPNGTSNSLPEDVQHEMIHSIPGMENAEFIRPGYAIEYDAIDPRMLDHSLCSQHHEGLYFAGQINGTTGYEEAAGQGLLAGINAACAARGDKPLILHRHESYIGVLVDDLVTKGTDEPYRMFTSRAEHRLLLRQDNAARRMLPHAKKLGLLRPEMQEDTERIDQEVLAEVKRLQPLHGVASLLNQEGRGYKDLPGARTDLHPESISQIEIELRYSGYLAREQQQVRKQQQMETVKLYTHLDYTNIRGLRFESAEKMNLVKPETLGQAARIQGVTPADISVLSVYLESVKKA